MWMTNKTMLKGFPVFMSLAPKPKSILPKPIRKIIDIIDDVRTINNVINGSIELSDVIASRIVGSITGPVIKKPFKDMLVSIAESDVSLFGVNGLGGHSWFKPEVKASERNVEKIVVVFHDANRAGRHLDVHIGNISFVLRYPQDIAYNSKGVLTKESQEAALRFLREKFSKNSSIPQNLDHSYSNARMEWFNGGAGINGYGAGRTRQVIFEEPVEIITTHDATSKVYAPLLNKHDTVFFHRLGSIVQVGPISKEPELADRLHLKSAESIDEFLKKVDPETVTLKEDSASAYIVTDKKGSTVWSPRVSKETGKRIEYTGKLPEMARIRGDFTGIGELKFKRGGSYLTAAEAGGILNSDRVRPRDVKPELWLYRADKIGGQKAPEEFFENRKAQESQRNQFIKVVRRVDPSFRDGEGLVGAPCGRSINDGYKVKWNGDQDDWMVVSNNLLYGATGRTAGTVLFESLRSGKQFKLGPGQIGSEATVKEWMGSDIVGRVAKVQSKRGHEGRAARFVEWHLDK